MLQDNPPKQLETLHMDTDLMVYRWFSSTKHFEPGLAADQKRFQKFHQIPMLEASLKMKTLPAFTEIKEFCFSN